MSNATPPPVPGAAAKKSGLSPLAWIAIGCGGLVAVALVVFIALSVFVFQKGKEVFEDATGSQSLEELMEGFKENPVRTAAETVIRMNPDLTLVETDDEAGTITFRNDRTGEEATLNFKDIAEGRFSMTTEEGEFSVDASEAGGEAGVTFKGPEGEARFGASANLDDVPDWVPLYPGAGDSQATFHSATGTGLAGAFSFKSADDAQTVIDRYAELFEDGGYEVRGRTMTTTPQGAFAGISGELPDTGRSVNVIVVQQGDESQVTINYNEKKP